MTPDTIDESRRTAARVAGLAFLFATAIVIVVGVWLLFRGLRPQASALAA